MRRSQVETPEETDNGGRVTSAVRFCQLRIGKGSIVPKTTAPELLSPSNASAGKPAGRNGALSLGSANQMATNLRFTSSSRTVGGFPAVFRAKASRMTALTVTDPRPELFVLRSAMYSEDPNGMSESSCRNTVKSVFRGKPSTSTLILSVPSSSAVPNIVIDPLGLKPAFII